MATFVAELTGALGPAVRGDSVASTAPWLTVDPELTQPGNRPSLHAPSASLGEPAPPARPRRRRALVALTAAALLATAGGAWAGYQVEVGTRPDVQRVSDAAGTLSVEVPAAWGASVGDEGWEGPEGSGSYAALSVGTDPAWTDPVVDGEGVFLGLMPGSGLPELMPQHPECEEAQSPVTEEGTQPSVTVLHTGCGDGVVVERVLQVAGNRLLWVQVRSRDRPTANRVLDSVSTSGI